MRDGEAKTSEVPWPLPCRMEDAEELHAIFPKAVGNDVRQARHDKLAGARDAAGPPHARVIGKVGDGPVNPIDDGEGRLGFIRGQIIGNRDQVAPGGNGPFDDHRARFFPLGMRSRAAFTASS